MKSLGMDHIKRLWRGRVISPSFLNESVLYIRDPLQEGSTPYGEGEYELNNNRPRRCKGYYYYYYYLTHTPLRHMG
jgi:hypothetical protein